MYLFFLLFTCLLLFLRTNTSENFYSVSLIDGLFDKQFQAVSSKTEMYTFLTDYIGKELLATKITTETCSCENRSAYSNTPNTCTCSGGGQDSRYCVDTTANNTLKTDVCTCSVTTGTNYSCQVSYYNIPQLRGLSILVGPIRLRSQRSKSTECPRAVRTSIKN